MVEEMVNLKRDHNKYLTIWLPFIILIEKINAISKETPCLFKVYKAKPTAKIPGYYCLYLHLHFFSSDKNSHSYIIFLIRSVTSHHSSHYNSVMHYSFWSETFLWELLVATRIQFKHFFQKFLSKLTNVPLLALAFSALVSASFPSLCQDFGSLSSGTGFGVTERPSIRHLCGKSIIR